MSTTWVPTPKDITRKWYVVDAKDQVLGRLATQVATVLRGKHKPIYTPFMDTGDHVIVINASEVRLTGKKLDNKLYRWHTGYPGGLKSMTYRKFIATRPERVIEKAVRGMLPRTPLGRAMIGKLKVYAGSEHPHAAQQPEPLRLGKD
ncbi:MAG TPA: 50S ribosomal protein L13 [Bacillota bacterium]|nr:50S ribosomal protein L13 [Bacillota bacterium]